MLLLRSTFSILLHKTLLSSAFLFLHFLLTMHMHNTLKHTLHLNAECNADGPGDVLSLFTHSLLVDGETLAPIPIHYSSRAKMCLCLLPQIFALWHLCRRYLSRSGRQAFFILLLTTLRCRPTTAVPTATRLESSDCITASDAHDPTSPTQKWSNKAVFNSP